MALGEFHAGARHSPAVATLTSQHGAGPAPPRPPFPRGWPLPVSWEHRGTLHSVPPSDAEFGRHTETGGQPGKYLVLVECDSHVGQIACGALGASICTVPCGTEKQVPPRRSLQLRYRRHRSNAQGKAAPCRGRPSHRRGDQFAGALDFSARSTRGGLCQLGPAPLSLRFPICQMRKSENPLGNDSQRLVVAPVPPAHDCLPVDSPRIDGRALPVSDLSFPVSVSPSCAQAPMVKDTHSLTSRSLLSVRQEVFLPTPKVCFSSNIP